MRRHDPYPLNNRYGLVNSILLKLTSVMVIWIFFKVSKLTEDDFSKEFSVVNEISLKLTFFIVKYPSMEV